MIKIIKIVSYNNSDNYQIIKLLVLYIKSSIKKLSNSSNKIKTVKKFQSTNWIT